MKEIQLTQGKVTLVDDEDYDYLNQFNWYATNDRGTYYAIRFITINGKRKRIAMHRVILNTPEGMEVDHIDHNGLNNQRCNIRNCTHQQNQHNNKSRKSSLFLGVHLHKGRYPKAQITINGSTIYIGSFKTEIDAAKAYDTKARELFGEFANLNFK